MSPDWILSLLSLVTMVLGQRSLGCFKSSYEDPDLVVRIFKRMYSPQQCIKECKVGYHMYAGMMSGYNCFCDSQYGRFGHSSDCRSKCPNHPARYCGWDEAINVWHTGQKGSSPPRNLEITGSSQFVLEVTWQPPEKPNGKIISYTLETRAIKTESSYPLPPTKTEVLAESSNSTVIYGLHPGTKYNVTIFATNINDFSFTEAKSDKASTEGWTRIGSPNPSQPPKILTRNDRTITIEIPEGSSENGPLSYYYVVVAQAKTIAPTWSDILYENSIKAEREEEETYRSSYYIAAKFSAVDYRRYQRFVVGDGRMIGGYFNAPLNISHLGIPRIGIALESRLRNDVQYSYSELHYVDV